MFETSSILPTTCSASVLPDDIKNVICGDDVPKLELVRVFSFHRVDKIIRHLRRIYVNNPDYFDIPIFAQNIY